MYDTSMSMPPALLPYNAYVQTQPRDIAPTELQKLYEAYWTKYMKDFSDHFFNLSCTEEWFQGMVWVWYGGGMLSCYMVCTHTPYAYFHIPTSFLHIHT
ncbi:DUF3546 domain-containing protein [archaeon]|nr:MAG: DUF3546 domain-containing protein [archaeon]